MPAERRHHVGFHLCWPAAFEAEQVDVVGWPCGHAVELDCVAASEDEPAAGDDLEREPRQLLLERVH
jgi:hypothetical protein